MLVGKREDLNNDTAKSIPRSCRLQGRQLEAASCQLLSPSAHYRSTPSGELLLHYSVVSPSSCATQHPHCPPTQGETRKPRSTHEATALLPVRGGKPHARPTSIFVGPSGWSHSSLPYVKHPHQSSYPRVPRAPRPRLATPNVRHNRCLASTALTRSHLTCVRTPANPPSLTGRLRKAARNESCKSRSPCPLPYMQVRSPDGESATTALEPWRWESGNAGWRQVGPPGLLRWAGRWKKAEAREGETQMLWTIDGNV